MQHYEEASRVRPEDYQALFLITGPLRQLGRLDDAEAVLRRGLEVAEKHLELNPDDARALYLSAAALIQLDQRERALEWAQRAYDMDPSDSALLYNVACVYALGGMADKALECLDRAILKGFGHREWLDNDTDLASLRSDPRFEALRQKL